MMSWPSLPDQYSDMWWETICHSLLHLRTRLGISNGLTRGVQTSVGSGPQRQANEWNMPVSGLLKICHKPVTCGAGGLSQKFQATNEGWSIEDWPSKHYKKKNKLPGPGIAIWSWNQILGFLFNLNDCRMCLLVELDLDLLNICQNRCELCHKNRNIGRAVFC